MRSSLTNQRFVSGLLAKLNFVFVKTLLLTSLSVTSTPLGCKSVMTEGFLKTLLLTFLCIIYLLGILCKEMLEAKSSSVNQVCHLGDPDISD